MGNPNLKGRKLETVIGLTKASKQRKGESTKSQEKEVRHKIENYGPKVGAISILSFSYKIIHARKFVIRRSM